MKNERGITLIALVITIIVMLILVTVTIRVATEGKLFTHAANAVKDTKTAMVGENAILNDQLDKSIENIVEEQTTETTAVTLIHFTVSGTPYTAEEGMTWAEWIGDPEYDSGSAYILSGLDWVYYSNGKLDAVSYTDIIADGGVYVLSSER